MFYCPSFVSFHVVPISHICFLFYLYCDAANGIYFLPVKGFMDWMVSYRETAFWKLGLFFFFFFDFEHVKVGSWLGLPLILSDFGHV